MNIDKLIDTPHTLIAGTTGSGKSVLLHQIIDKLVDKYCLLEFIDLKVVELSEYKSVDGCLGYVTEPGDICYELDWLIDEMKDRFAKMEGKHSDEIPIYIVIDELADVLSEDGVLERLVKIGRLGRAANIHLLCATQDPSRRTLRAQLMQNFTCCVALRCRSAIESRQIIGVPGAETLPKHGYGYRWDADGIEKFAIPYAG